MVRQYCSDASIPVELVSVLDWPVDAALSFFDAIKLRFHQNVDTLDATWPNYMDLGNLAGYPKMEDRELKDDPVAWLSSPPTSLYSESWWHNQFLETFGESLVGNTLGLLSYEDFVLNRWLWSTGGATSLSKALLDGSPVKTKFGAALSLTDKQLLDIARAPSSVIGVFLKPD